jgi:hypothetical protein
VQFVRVVTARTWFPAAHRLLAGSDMHHPALSLLALQDRSLGAQERRELAPQRVMAALGLAGTLSIAMLLAGMPLIAMGIVAAVSTAFAVRSKGSSAARALRSAALPAPEAILPLDLRDAYRGILASYDEVERGIASARRLRSEIDPILERCMASVELCGRLALLANPLQHHLEVHDPRVLRTELEHLGARCEATTDEDAARMLRGAIAARTRELANLDQMVVMRERIHARLESCRAAFSAFAAVIVKLHVAEEEQLAMAGGSPTEQLDGVTATLEILEAVLAVEPDTAKASASGDDDEAAAAAGV